MIETREKVIDGKEYVVTQFPASEGLAILSELMQLFGESLGRTETGMGDAVEALVKQLAQKNIIALVHKLVGKNIKCDGEALQGEHNFDFHFSGQYKHLAEVIMFVLEANFEDFLPDLKETLSIALMATIFKGVAIPGEISSETAGDVEEATGPKSPKTKMVGLACGVG